VKWVRMGEREVSQGVICAIASGAGKSCQDSG
jgi:hypothetical protein